MKRLIVWLSILTLQVTVAGATWAEGSDSSPGFYLQGAFAMQSATGNVEALFDTFASSSTAKGGSVAAGYFLTDWLALQARLQILSMPELRFPGVNVAIVGLIYSGAAKFYPLTLLTQDPNGLIQPYAIAGLGGESIIGNCAVASGFCFFDGGTTFILELGGGLDLMLSDNIGLFGEATYQYVNEDPVATSLALGDLSTSAIGFNVGVSYRF